jgi:hypothetical protein
MKQIGTTNANPPNDIPHPNPWYNAETYGMLVLYIINNFIAFLGYGVNLIILDAILKLDIF